MPLIIIFSFAGNKNRIRSTAELFGMDESPFHRCSERVHHQVHIISHHQVSEDGGSKSRRLLLEVEKVISAFNKCKGDPFSYVYLFHVQICGFKNNLGAVNSFLWRYAVVPERFVPTVSTQSHWRFRKYETPTSALPTCFLAIVAEKNSRRWW